MPDKPSGSWWSCLVVWIDPVTDGQGRSTHDAHRPLQTGETLRHARSSGTGEGTSPYPSGHPRAMTKRRLPFGSPRATGSVPEPGSEMHLPQARLQAPCASFESADERAPAALAGRAASGADPACAPPGRTPSDSRSSAFLDSGSRSSTQPMGLAGRSAEPGLFRLACGLRELAVPCPCRGRVQGAPDRRARDEGSATGLGTCPRRRRGRSRTVNA
jgi:hypothetical protein